VGGTHLGDTFPKGRRKYYCYLCGLRIRKGARHVKRVGVYDGEFVVSRMHEVCEAATKGWEEFDWECHDDWEFRRYTLGLGQPQR
jgi:hypothetical protein